MSESNTKEILKWFDKFAKPFFEKNAPEKLPSHKTISGQSIELVWTGPTTPFVSARRTEQAL